MLPNHSRLLHPSLNDRSFGLLQLNHRFLEGKKTQKGQPGYLDSPKKWAQCILTELPFWGSKKCVFFELVKSETPKKEGFEVNIPPTSPLQIHSKSLLGTWRPWDFSSLFLKSQRIYMWCLRTCGDFGCGLGALVFACQHVFSVSFLLLVF